MFGLGHQSDRYIPTQITDMKSYKVSCGMNDSFIIGTRVV